MGFFNVHSNDIYNVHSIEFFSMSIRMILFRKIQTEVSYYELTKKH